MGPIRRRNGSHYATDRAVDAYVCDRLRNLLVRRHKMPSRHIGPFTMEAVFGELGVLRMRRTGALS